MQHLDEGTIHAWLDGALTPEEAGQADAHVKECPQCQAAVAEARGFIAASSRILTALDDAPRGVIPIAPKKRVQPWVWRIAATALVVATGTVLLVKERGSEGRTATSSTADSGALFKAPAVGTPFTALPQEAAAADSTGVRRATGQRVSAPAATRPSAPPGTVSGVANAPIDATVKPSLSAGNVATRAQADVRRVDAPSELKSEVAEPVVAPRAPAAAPAATSLRQSFGVAGAVSTPMGPREVGTKRFLGRTQTFYEIAPGDTVVLEEQVSPHLENVVITGAAAGRADQAQAPRRAEKSAAAAVESQQKTAAAADFSARRGA